MKELFPYVEEQFNIDDQKRRIEGMSAGGLGATKFMIRYPTYFHSAVSFGGAILDAEHPELTPMPVKQTRLNEIIYSGDLDYLRKRSIQRAVMEGRVPHDLNLHFVIGDKDPTKDMNDRFQNLLKSAGVDTKFTVLPGVEHYMKLYLGVWEQGVQEFAALSSQ